MRTDFAAGAMPIDGVETVATLIRASIRDVAGSPEDWAVIRAGNGTAVQVLTGDVQEARIFASATTDKWGRFYRVSIGIPTTGYDASLVPTSPTYVSVTYDGIQDAFGASVAITGVSGALTGAAGDYQLASDALWSDDTYALATMDPDGVLTFELNGAGLTGLETAIAAQTPFYFMLRIEADASNVEPTWAGSTAAFFGVYKTTHGSHDTKMVVTGVAGELPLLESGEYDEHWRVKVANGDGTMIDVSSRLQGGTIRFPQPDAPIGTAELTFAREINDDELLSLAPLVDASAYNRLDDTVTISPLFHIGREATVEVAITARGAARPADGSTSWHEVIGGYAKQPSWPKRYGDITLEIHDRAYKLMRTYIEDPQTYAVTTPIEDVIQELLTDVMGSGMYTLYVDDVANSPSGTTGSALSVNYEPEIQPLWEAMQSLASSIGWVLWYRYDSNGVAQLTLTEPRRAKTVADYTFTNAQIQDVTALTVIEEDIRNVVVVHYVDADGAPQSVTSSDATSITNYGGIRRYISVTEDDTSPIRTQAAAEALRDAILSDLKDPDADHAIETYGAWWPGEPSVDLYEFAANTFLYDNAQTLAPYSLEITFQQGQQAKAVIASRGKPSGGSGRWTGRRPGGILPNELLGVWIETRTVTVPTFPGYLVMLYVELFWQTASPKTASISAEWFEDGVSKGTVNFNTSGETAGRYLLTNLPAGSYWSAVCTPYDATGGSGGTGSPGTSLPTPNLTGQNLAKWQNAGDTTTIESNVTKAGTNLEAVDDSGPKINLKAGLTGVLGHDGSNLGNQGSAFNWDADNGNIQRVTLTASVTITPTNFPSSYIAPCILIVEYGGAYTPTFSGVDWGGAGTPAWSADSDKADIVTVMRVGSVYMASAQTGFTNP